MSWPNEWGIILLSLSAICIFVPLLTKQKVEKKISISSLLILLWFLSTLIGFIINGVTALGFQNEILFLSYLIFYFLVKFHSHSGLRKKIILFLIFSAFAYSIFYGLYQHFQGLKETLDHIMQLNLPQGDNKVFMNRLLGKKVFSTFIYSNSFASYIIIFLPIFFNFLFNKTYRKTLIYSVIAGFSMLLILLISMNNYEKIIHYILAFSLFPFSIIFTLLKTHSEGAFIAIISSISLFVVIYINKNIKNMILKILIIITGCVTLFAIKDPVIKKVQPSLKVRSDYNYSSMQMIKHNPFFGIGPGKYGTYYMHYKLPDAEEVQLAHNSFLQMFAENGFFSFILFILILSVFIHALFKAKGITHPMLFISLVSIILHNLADFSLYVPSLGYSIFYIFSLIPENDFGYTIDKKNKFFSKILITMLITSLFFLLYLYSNISRSISYKERGGRFLSEKKIFLATKSFKESIKYFPKDISNYITLAQLYNSTKDTKQALMYLEKALELSPKNAMTWLKYARCLYYDSKYDNNIKIKEILTAYQNAIKFYPANTKIIDEYNRFKLFFSKK